MNRLRLFSFIGLLTLPGAALAADPSEVIAAAPNPALRIERLSFESGAELITVFERLPKENARRELPLLAILKDTLNDADPRNDRLRQVWVFTYSQPSIWQRVAGGIPFLYHRSGLGRDASSHPPRPVMDLGDPSHGLWAGLGMAAVQSEVVDPVGALARLTTHSFFGNYGEYRKTHIWEAGDVMSTLLRSDLDGALTPQETEQVEERLELAGHPLGGLVADQYLHRDYAKLRARQTETRGHNWELLRQRAEETGLYLQAPESGGLPEPVALLWIAEPDLESGSNFDRKFLNIANPFTDQRLRHWDGYSQTWYLDRNGVPVDADAESARPVRMLPLALYGLDHPRAPLLLVDFRRSGHPRRRELGLKLAEDATTGVLSLTGYGELGYLTVKSSWMFVQTRHGGATNRPARRRAFVFVRHAIGAGSGIEPNFRSEILSRIEKVDLNPIEGSWDREIRDGWRQYDALLAYASGTGLKREIQRDREQETRASVHGPGARALQRLATFGTVGIYRHRDSVTDSQMEALDQNRRTAWLKNQPQSLPPDDAPVVAAGRDPAPAVMKSGAVQ